MLQAWLLQIAFVHVLCSVLLRRSDRYSPDVITFLRWATLSLVELMPVRLPSIASAIEALVIFS